MAEESRRYLREQIELQKRQIAEQHDVIAQMYVEDLSTGLYNRNRYNQVCAPCPERIAAAWASPTST